MKKLRSILLLVITAVLLTGISSFAGYKAGFGNGFKVGFIVGARQIFSSLTGKSPDELEFNQLVPQDK
jgi:hypothetical protein